MKKIAVILTIICLSFSFTACSNEKPNQVKEDKTEKLTEQMTLTSEPKEEDIKEDYQEYSGYWSVNGDSHDEIVANGGIELYCSITEDNLFEGWIFAQQGLTESIAEIDNIFGQIKNNEVLFDFSDDGWGNSGTLHIVFSETTINVEVTDFKMNEENLTGYGISGNYSFVRMRDIGKIEQSMDINSMAEEELMEKVNSRSQYYMASKYYDQVRDYWENNRETRDISNVLEPLFNTDTVVYTKSDLSDEPDFIIHLGKNEIYARHGYIFKDEELNNYFKGCVWYKPITTAEEFDDSVFNEIEKENLKLFSEMDTFE